MLGNRIRELRMANKLTQEYLADKLGVTKQAVSNWENNNIAPSIEQVIKVSKFFCVSTDYLLEMNNSIKLEVDELSIEEIAHLQAIISDLKNK